MSGAGHSRTAALAARVYAVGIRLLPGAFRDAHGPELRRCFRAIAVETRVRRGRVAVAGVTLRALLDVLTTAPGQHLAGARARVLGAGGSSTGLWQDVRHAARRLRRRPSFALTTVLTLGLGLAAATAVFSLVYGVVLSPLRYPDAGRIVQLDHAAPGVGADDGLGMAYGFYRHYAEHARAAEALALYNHFEQTLVGAGDPVRLSGVAATPSLEAVLGVPPALGRWFTVAEGRSGAPLVVVLADGLWRERFGADPSVLGRTINLGGVQREVVGVMPATFAFPSAEVAFWVPRVVPDTRLGGWNEQAVARLAPGTDAAALQHELASLLPALRQATDDPATLAEYLDNALVSPLVVPLKESIVGHVRPTLWILLGTVSLVLLIAVANVANLFLARADEARRETALRRALGAGRGHIVRGFLVETLLVALMAGGVGLALASAAIRCCGRARRSTCRGWTRWACSRRCWPCCSWPSWRPPWRSDSSPPSGAAGTRPPPWPTAAAAAAAARRDAPTAGAVTY
ncbi:MAG: ABC transporter permease [Gemmatimonadota bacterium]